MPSLISSGPGSTTGVDFASNAFWRLCLGATMIESTPALSLVLRYPPGDQQSQVALLRVPVPVAQSPEEVVRISEVALMGNSREADIERLQEAYTMFKNNPRVPSAAALEEATNAGVTLVQAYWQIHDWLFDGCQETLTVDSVKDYKLKGLP